MEDEIYRKILKMKALERWENEGGRIINDVTSVNRDHSTDVESGTYIGAGIKDVGH